MLVIFYFLKLSTTLDIGYSASSDSYSPSVNVFSLSHYCILSPQPFLYMLVPPGILSVDTALNMLFAPWGSLPNAKMHPSWISESNIQHIAGYLHLDEHKHLKTGIPKGKVVFINRMVSGIRMSGHKSHSARIIDMTFRKFLNVRPWILVSLALKSFED